MGFQRAMVFGFPQIKNPLPLLLQSRLFSNLQPAHTPKHGPSFGVAFDIDGVILGGRTPIGGSPGALRRLYGNSGSLEVPFLFFTNGGGVPESRRAAEMSELLGLKILPSQVLQGHTPFKSLLKRYENELIIATGKGDPALVMFDYGFKKVLSFDEYASLFEHIDPVSQYKRWTTNQVLIGCGQSMKAVPKYNISAETVKAVFVVSDPVDWGRDIQVICDVLRSGGIPGQNNGGRPSIYFAADDLEYQAAFPTQRLGMGAFRIALESVFNRIHQDPLEYVSFGKPNPSAFKNAEAMLKQLHPSYHSDNFKDCCRDDTELPQFETIYMIGDNPSVDIKGARLAGHPWFSILTRTGVFRGEQHNHAEFPADLVVDTVEDAVDYILRREYS